MESIIAAIITAIASIIVALIQANFANKQAQILRQRALQTTTTPVKPAPESFLLDKFEVVSALPLSAKAVIGRFDRIWFLVGGILAVEAIVFGIINQDLTPFVNMLVLIPLSTCILSFFRPVFWGYSAVFVTFLQGVAFLGYILGGGHVTEGEVQTIALLFIANAGLCALISFVRLRKEIEKLNEG